MNVKYNISRIGHYRKGPQSEEKYLKRLLSKDGGAKISNKLSNKNINIILEGHMTKNHSYVIKELKKCKEKKILILTEAITGCKKLHYKFFTFNHEKIIFRELSNKDVRAQLILNYFFFFLKKILKTINNKLSFSYRLENYLGIKINNKIANIYNDTFYWKERYNNFLDTLNYIDEIWFLRQTYLDFYKNILTKKKIKYQIIFHNFFKVKQYKNKKYNFLISGNLGEYRENIIKNLNKNLGIKVINVKNEKKFYKYIRQSKYYIILNKTKFGIFPTSSRMLAALENDSIPIVESTFFRDELNRLCFNTKVINNKYLKKVLRNYTKNYKININKKNKFIKSKI